MRRALSVVCIGPNSRREQPNWTVFLVNAVLDWHLLDKEDRMNFLMCLCMQLQGRIAVKCRSEMGTTNFKWCMRTNISAFIDYVPSPAWNSAVPKVVQKGFKLRHNIQEHTRGAFVCMRNEWAPLSKLLCSPTTLWNMYGLHPS
jgi:hypothetical protein